MPSRRVITHIHSDASNDQASQMFPLISRLATEIVGPQGATLPWFECQTSVNDLLAILDGHRTGRHVDLLFLTDHLSGRRHHLPEAVFDLACRDHRFGVGGEVQTALADEAGRWLDAPEVLVYGPAELRSRGACRYYGITQEELDELFDRCTPSSAPAPEVMQVRQFCADRGWAYSLAHPLDGHDLPLSQWLPIFEAFPCIETMNGGYSEESGRLLMRLAASRPDKIAIGGGDAHLDDFDRVVTTFEFEGDRPVAGDFIRAMLDATAGRGAASITVEGHGITTWTLYREVLTLVGRNVRNIRPLLGSTWKTARILALGALGASGELRRMDRNARKLRADLSAWLDDSSRT